MTDSILHFTLGPVQGFVAQARRTRDLWAGSFLLSWLSGQAMAAVLEQGGRIVFPQVGDRGDPKDPLLRAIMKGEGQPRIGSLPNRFKARVPEGFEPDKVVGRLMEKWCELADRVYEVYVKPVEIEGKDTRVIWDRQIGGFWEINWVLGEDPGNGEDRHWLDRRKNWRDLWPEPEAGTHCSIMGDYQEISGYVRSCERDQQDKFWKALQDKAPHQRLDIRDNERLCAIALVKRLFPQLPKDKLIEVIGWIPGGDHKKIANWPSTTYMAVTPWLARIAGEDELRKELCDYVQTVRTRVKHLFPRLASEHATRLACLEPLRKEDCKVDGHYPDDLDGDLYHPHSLANPRTTYLSDQRPKSFGDDPDRAKRGELLKALGKLTKAAGGPPRSYYALLVMDGDRMGALLQEQDPGRVSLALADFTARVPEIVGDHNGVTIYAGGDDVLALLTLDFAIGCADRLRKTFRACFTDQGLTATASGGIVFAHHQVPLRDVLREAHRQLEQVAKERNGRNSLALAVYKPGGVTTSWVNPWEVEASPVASLQRLTEAMDNKADVYPRGFYHKLQDRYRLFMGEGESQVDLARILVAEYLQTRERETTLDEAQIAVDRLLEGCRHWRRRDEGIEPAGLAMDGGFIARFLTQGED
jgi:CRISPR-associated protein Cmr2